MRVERKKGIWISERNVSVNFADKPGPAAISYSPKLVVKKNSLNISCSVTDMGRPEVSGFKWMRGSHRLPDENKSVLSIESVNLETEANFTCMAYNEAGDGDPATTFIDVSGEQPIRFRGTAISLQFRPCSPVELAII